MRKTVNWAGALLVVTIGLIALSAWRQRNPLQLVHERDIVAAGEMLLADARSPTSRAKLQAMMVKLRDGWDGLVADEDYPYKFTSKDLLGYLYWDTSRACAGAKPETRDALVRLLHETAPLSTSDKYWHHYTITLQRFGIELPKP